MSIKYKDRKGVVRKITTKSLKVVGDLVFMLQSLGYKIIKVEGI